MENFFLLFITCLKVGFLTVGGAAGIFAVLAHELVDRGGWLSLDEFLYGISLGEITPGPAILGMGIVGVKWGGWLGGTLIICGLALPGMAWMWLAIQSTRKLKRWPWLEGFLKGAELAVPALLVTLALKLLPADAPLKWPILVAGVAAWVTLRFRIHGALVVLGSILIGFLLS